MREFPLIDTRYHNRVHDSILITLPS